MYITKYNNLKKLDISKKLKSITQEDINDFYEILSFINFSNIDILISCFVQNSGSKYPKIF